MSRISLAVLITVFSLAGASADEGLVKIKSPYGVSETLDRFEAAVTDKGMTVFARIDHAAGAAKAGLELRPTELLIFGNPKVGTLLMQSSQSAGIDLPLKTLAWRDADGQVWLAYNDPEYLVRRHAIADRGEVVKKMSMALKSFSGAATGK